LDIYVSKRNINGNWGAATNLGPVVNSRFHDDTPFISVDGKRLYYSSIGHNSGGGYDIFVSQFTDSKKWSKPINMGYPFNTSDDELFYSPHADQMSGLFAFYDPNDTEGLYDIYVFEVFNEVNPRTFKLRGLISVLNKEQKLNEIILKLINSDGIVVGSTSPNNKGRYELNAIQGNYNLAVEGDYVINDTINVLLSPDNVNAIIGLSDIELQDDKHALSIANTKKMEDLKKFFVEQNVIMVQDEGPVEISINTPGGKILRISTSWNDSIIDSKNIRTSQAPIKYVFDPLPGDNVVMIELMDNDTVLAAEKIVVIRETSDVITRLSETEEQTVHLEKKQVLPLGIDLTKVVTGELKEYLINNPLPSDYSLPMIYKELLSKTTSHGFDTADVDFLVSILLTQKDMEVFESQVENNLSPRMVELLQKTGQKLPLSQLSTARAELLEPQNEKLNQGLLSMVIGELDNDLYFVPYLYSFIYNEKSQINIEGVSDINHFMARVNQKKLANGMLDLAATTTELSLFYQNLLFEADDSLRNR
ncbi:MAG: hypothetical protein MI922_21405, partial [Bacteroidales bacterium]|nr:hypothetical protein [Bacteroidales bacterium]